MKSFERACQELPDIEQLPDKAYEGDVCKYKGSFFVYFGGWMPMEKALDLIYEIT